MSVAFRSKASRAMLGVTHAPARAVPDVPPMVRPSSSFGGGSLSLSMLSIIGTAVIFPPQFGDLTVVIVLLSRSDCLSGRRID